MEDIKLIIDGESVGSVSINDAGTIEDVFIHKTAPEGTLQTISEHDPLGEKINSEGYHIITT
jgi:hypothetical protein